MIDRTSWFLPRCLSVLFKRSNTLAATFSLDSPSSIPFTRLNLPPLFSQVNMARSTTGCRNSSTRSRTMDGLAAPVYVHKAGEGLQAGVHYGAPDVRIENPITVVQSGIHAVPRPLMLAPL